MHWDQLSSFLALHQPRTTKPLLHAKTLGIAASGWLQLPSWPCLWSFWGLVGGSVTFIAQADYSNSGNELPGWA